MPRTKPFRIGHLSDLHLTARDGDARSEPKLFGKLIGMNAAFRHIVSHPEVQSLDRLLVTGDVTDRGDIEAWHVFWNTLSDSGLAAKAMVIPGNHDLCCLGLRFPSPDDQRSDLARAAAGLRIGGQPTRLPWAHVPDERVVVFGLNSSNMGNSLLLSNAVGRLGYFDLKAFAALLHKHRDVPVKIVALHHSPNIPEQSTSERRGEPPTGGLDRLAMQIPQDQRRALLLLCIAHKVRIIAHGHVHVARNRRISGVRIVGAPATTEPASNGVYRFYRYDVQGEGGRVACSLKSLSMA